MKILMVCTHPNGGATIAARRQAEALRAAGAHCDLVSMKEDWESTDSSVWVTRDEHEIAIHIPASLWSYFGRITLAICNENRTNISNTWFSFFPVETALDKALLEICHEYDVIHFHWIAQMVSARFLDELAQDKRRIVITSHDMNHFTGGCHYNANCENYQQECSSCQQLLADPLKVVTSSFYRKLAAFASLESTWLFPSKWLADCFRSSRLQDNPDATKVLHNCIDTDKFHYLDPATRSTQRSELNFSIQELVLVAGTADNTELRKGFQYIESAIQNLSHFIDIKGSLQNPVVVVTFGAGTPEIEADSQFIRHMHLGPIDEKVVISLFQCADLLLMPSIEENFANTILESLMCGCPVLAFNIGGVPDIIEHDINGWLSADVSHESFSNALKQLVCEGKLPGLYEQTRVWRDENATRYSYPVHAPKLLNIYKNDHDVTHPRTIKKPIEILSSEELYSNLFGWFTFNDTDSCRMLAANFNSHICSVSNQDLSPAEQNPFVVPAIFKGFSSLASLDDVGRAGWVTKRACVFFSYDGRTQPALCIQLPRSQNNLLNFDKALSRLTAAINGVTLDVTIVKSDTETSYDYLWVIPRTDSLLKDSYNTIELNFKAPSIPEDVDPRGLCLLYYQTTVFDLGNATLSRDQGVAPSHGLSTSLAIKASQEHYLWEYWTAQQHAEAGLPNTVEMWIDLISNNSVGHVT